MMTMKNAFHPLRQNGSKGIADGARLLIWQEDYLSIKQEMWKSVVPW